MTKHEAAVVMAVTGTTMLTGDDFGIFHKYCEDLLGYPIWTHQFPLLEDLIKEKAMPEFIDICKNLEE